MFDAILNAFFFCRCYLTSRVALRSLERYITDIFRHIEDLFSHIQSCYDILQVLAYLGTFCFSHTQAYSKRYTQYLSTVGHIHVYLGRFRHIQNSDLFRHVMFHAYSGIFSTLEFVTKQYFMQNRNFSNLERKMSYLCNSGLKV